MYPLSRANTLHVVRNFTVDGMIRDTKRFEYHENRA